VPPRILFAPLFAVLPAVQAQGGASVAALYRALEAAITEAPRSAFAPHHAEVFGFLLRGLDALAGSASPSEAEAAEAACCKAVVALVLKLSEAQFRPLFGRLAEWATELVGLEAGGEADGSAALVVALRLAEPGGPWRRLVTLYNVSAAVGAALKVPPAAPRPPATLHGSDDLLGCPQLSLAVLKHPDSPLTLSHPWR
jgi:hypothetical protein